MTIASSNPCFGSPAASRRNPACPGLTRMRRLLLAFLAAGAGLLCAPTYAQQATPPQAVPTQTQQRADSAIAEDLNSKLMASNTLRPLDLGIWVHSGIVTLTGTVPTQALRTQAEQMAKSVAGVQSIDDKIAIGAPPQSAPGFSGQQQNGVPGNQETPPPPPPGYSQNGEAPSPNSPPSPSSPPEPGNPAESGYGQNAPPPPANNPSQTLTIAPKTPIYVMIMQTLDSKHTQLGQRFHGILVQDVVVQNGMIAVPKGADVFGTVIDARGPGHLKGRPHLALQLTGLNVANSTYPLSSYIWARGGPGKGGQSTANIVGGGLAGTVLGGAFGGGDGALLGGLLGGVGGAGLSSLWGGPRLMIPAESVLTFYLNAPLTVHEPTEGEIRMLASHLPPSAYGRRRRGYGGSQPPGYPQPGYPPPGYPPPGGPPGGYPY